MLADKLNIILALHLLPVKKAIMLQFDCEYLQINARNWCFVKLRNSTSNKWLLECFFYFVLPLKDLLF